MDEHAFPPTGFAVARLCDTFLLTVCSSVDLQGVELPPLDAKHVGNEADQFVSGHSLLCFEIP